MSGLSQLYEDDLLNLLADGDESAFTEIYNRYWKKLYYLALKHLSSPSRSEEIVQEVFLLLWKKRSSIRIESLPLYLAAMTRYAVYRSMARQAKAREFGFTDLAQEPSTGDGLHALDNKLLMDMVKKLSGRLPEKCRLVFLHNKLLDQPLEKVAQDLGISVKTAEAHLTKALKIIRRKAGSLLPILCL